LEEKKKKKKKKQKKNEHNNGNMLYITDFMLEGHYRWNGGLLLEGRTTVGTEDYCWKGAALSSYSQLF